MGDDTADIDRLSHYVSIGKNIAYHENDAASRSVVVVHSGGDAAQ